MAALNPINSLNFIEFRMVSFKFITEPPYSLDIISLTFHLHSKFLNMCIYRPRISKIVEIPDSIQDLVSI